MLLDEYSIHPWQMERYTGREIKVLYRYHAEKVRHQRDAEEG